MPRRSSNVSGLSTDSGLANAEEARAFELWLRNLWTAKERRLEQFYESQRFDGPCDIVPIQQMYVGRSLHAGINVDRLDLSKWYHWISAIGGGGLGTVVLLAFCIWFAVCR